MEQRTKKYLIMAAIAALVLFGLVGWFWSVE
jgi:hypothetical protein